MDVEPVDTSYFGSLLKKLTPREALIVAENRVVVGWGIVKEYSDRQGYRYACETSVYVAATEQRRGYGAVLLGAVVERAGSLGYQHLVAKIVAANELSIGFHERFGYEMVGRQRRIGFLNGVWHDIVIMQRIVESIDRAGVSG